MPGRGDLAVAGVEPGLLELGLQLPELVDLALAGLDEVGRDARDGVGDLDRGLAPQRRDRVLGEVVVAGRGLGRQHHVVRLPALQARRAEQRPGVGVEVEAGGEAVGARAGELDTPDVASAGDPVAGVVTDLDADGPGTGRCLDADAVTDPSELRGGSVDAVDVPVVAVHRRHPEARALGETRDGEEGVLLLVPLVVAVLRQRAGVGPQVEGRHHVVAQDVAVGGGDHAIAEDD